MCLRHAIIHPMRRAALASVLFIAVTSTAWATAPMHPYNIAPARKCLIRHHARLARTKYTSHPNQIQWLLSPKSRAAPPTNWLLMTFSETPAQSATLERSHERNLHSSRAWLRHHVTRRGNVVIENDFIQHPLTAKQVATITGCLRRAA
jgi:hypothetical protein